MEGRGDTFASGTPEGPRRPDLDVAVPLRDEGRPERSTGREGPPDSTRLGVAPLVRDPIESPPRRSRSFHDPERWSARADRRFAHSEAAAATELLHHLGEAASAEMALLDGRGVVVSVNAAWRAASATAGQAVTGLGRNYVEVCRWLAPELEQRTLRKALDELLSGASQSFVHTCERDGPEGRCWRQVRISRLRVGTDVHIIAIHEDLAEVSRAQAALRATAVQLLSAQEDERHRIAVELHDSTSQHLVALGLGLTNLRRLANKDGRVEQVLADMGQSLQEAVKEIRVLSYLMKPMGFEQEGLAAQARRFVSGFGSRTGLQTRFTVKGSVDKLEADIQHTLFRVIQEALANVYRHAAARTVSVELLCRRGALEVRIVDDGKGIAALRTGGIEDVALGVGIAGMRTRMAQLGGDLRIESCGHGTVVSGVLPLAATRAAARRPPSVNV